MTPRRRALFAVVALTVGGASCGASRDALYARMTTTGQSSGPADAPTVVVLFADYACGPCASHGRRLRRLLERDPRPARLVYHHCPSRAHPVARSAALLAAAAAGQGRFWEIHWALVEAGPIRDEESLHDVARAAGLDMPRLEADLASGRPAEAIEADLRLADRLGLHGTPTTFVGSHRIEGAVRESTLEAALAGTTVPP